MLRQTYSDKCSCFRGLNLGKEGANVARLESAYRSLPIVTLPTRSVALNGGPRGAITLEAALS